MVERQPGFAVCHFRPYVMQYSSAYQLGYKVLKLTCSGIRSLHHGLRRWIVVLRISLSRVCVAWEIRYVVCIASSTSCQGDSAESSISMEEMLYA